jgi:predicted NBD/HSP70 family sugar kinase
VARRASRPLFAAARADHGTVRRNNLSLIMRTLQRSGARSRARLASDTGLTKATVSSLVAELVDRGLVSEGEIQREGGIGRPGQTIDLNRHHVCGIGVEVNVDYVAVLALNLRNEVLISRRLPLGVQAIGPTRVLIRAATLLSEAVAELETMGTAPVGVTIALPGLLDVEHGVLTYAPNLGWRDVPVVDMVRKAMPDAEFALRVDNDANLSALAEFLGGADGGISDLVYLTGEVGIGAGVIAHGQLLRGADGFSGEVGHMPLDAAGQRCGCGRVGCWETMVGLAALMRLAAAPDDVVRNPELDLEQRLAIIHARAGAGDPTVLAALDRIGHDLGLGASILMNVLNPDVLVLGGYFAVLGEFLVGPVAEELADRVVAGNPCRVSLSILGFTAAGRGGAHVALEAIFTDPTLVPFLDEYQGVEVQR